MSLLKVKEIAVGNSATTIDNFVVYQPVVPDATLRIANGIPGSSTVTATFSSGGNLTITGEFIETSSIEYKENVVPLSGALAAITSLRGVNYNKIGKDNTEAGLIAEEVAELIPEVVSYTKTGAPEGIKYAKLTVYLIEAVKELQEEIRTLKNG